MPKFIEIAKRNYVLVENEYSNYFKRIRNKQLILLIPHVINILINQLFKILF